MKKLISFLIFLIMLSSVLATIEPVAKDSFMPFSLVGKTVVSPGATEKYKLILDTATGCYGHSETKVYWSGSCVGSSCTSLTMTSYGNNVITIAGAYANEISVKFPTSPGDFYITARSVCSAGSFTEKLNMKVGSCTNECSSSQKRCRDTQTRQDCTLTSGCYVWGSIWTCKSDEMCTNGACVVKLENQCRLGDIKCVDKNYYETCKLVNGVYRFVGTATNYVGSGKDCVNNAIVNEYSNCAYKKCDNDNIYCFDSNDEKTTLYKDCASQNMQCLNNNCEAIADTCVNGEIKTRECNGGVIASDECINGKYSDIYYCPTPGTCDLDVTNKPCDKAKILESCEWDVSNCDEDDNGISKYKNIFIIGGIIIVLILIVGIILKKKRVF